ncbi:MAG: hypothetical protein OXR66_01025 [Candidatus Woesearchaeota archaeon]|nr:hypothetical protein [Candidatus Woesearchaeota archaeon]
MVNINIELPHELHKRLKLAAATEDTTIKELFVRMLADGEHGQH